MKKRTDVIITTLFLLIFGFYTLFGWAFGGMGGENQVPYVTATVAGLMLLFVSLTVSSIKKLFWTRIAGLVLVASLLYFDIRSLYTLETFWKNLLSVLAYFPLMVFMLYVFFSIRRLRRANTPEKR